MPPNISEYSVVDCEAVTGYPRKRSTKGKRQLDFNGLDKPVKRRRSFGVTEAKQTQEEKSIESIIEAVERLSTEPRLVSDGSRENTMPTMSGKHKDLNAITPETMSRALQGAYSDRIDQLTVIDCRYPYEFEGGHIKGAINLYTKQAIKDFIHNSATSSEKNHVLIFHSKQTIEGKERSIESIIAAVERLSTEPRLVSDGSRENTLPTISGKQKDLNAITPETMSRALEDYSSS
ncbi:M-phase inducer phosphatase 1-like [Dreissena polymorpha]|uniref:M-phase inducer phosphatase 1-like n=1 Tax=Dreissena polymorpha TaxID=45954 RepID=UPI0022646D22|nr:M-phase inducer phosphatase 1-like [Dreissena polymorpha]